MQRFSSWRNWVWLGVVLAVAATTGSVRGDDAFLGALALVEEPQVAQQLKLSDDVRAKLRTLLDERTSAATELALEVKDLPPDARSAKLAEFAAETEKQGFALLTPEQQSTLSQISLSRAGVQALAKPDVAEALKLSDSQKASVAKLLGELQTATLQGSAVQRQAARARIERELAGTLSQSQRATWDQMTGRLGPTAKVATAAAPPLAEADPAATAEKTPSTTPANPAPSSAPAATTTADKATNKSSSTKAADGDVKLKFQFRYAPWKDVLEWFAQQADLSLVMDVPPPGTFNYSDNRSYSPSEAIDLINGVLLTKGYNIIRRERMLMVVNLEDGIPPGLVDRIPVEELDERGKYEIVSCLFPLNKWKPEEAEAEVRKLIGPQGSVVVMPQARQLFVTETAGKLRTIRSVIDAVENPPVPKDEKVVVIDLKHSTPSEFLTLARPLLGIADNASATPDGSLRLSVDELGNRLLVTGKPERLEQLQEMVKLIDVAGPGDDEIEGGSIEQPQLEVYAITQADPQAVLQVMQTLLAGLPDVRLAIDTKTGNLVALAKPSQHATIRATLEQMQRDGTQMEVFKLRRLDPQAVVLQINQLFGGTAEGAAANGPKVNADSTNMTLVVRGTVGQVAQVKDLLTKLGETGDGDILEAGERTNIRILPLSGRSVESALQQIESVWSTAHQNKIRIVRPSQSQTSIPTRTVSPETKGESPAPPQDLDAIRAARIRELMELLNEMEPPTPADRAPPSQTAPESSQPKLQPAPQPPKPDDRTTHVPRRLFHFVSQPTSAADEPNNSAEPKTTESNPAGQSLADRYDPAVIEYVEQEILAKQDTNGDGYLDPEEWKAGKWATPPEASDTDKDGRLSKEELCARIAARESARAKEEAAKSVPGAEIVVTVTPNGIMISSEDLDALDEFEQLLRAAAEPQTGQKEYTVFYLKYARAEVAATLVQEAIGGGVPDSGGGGGGSLMGDIAATMLGGDGGGLLGGLLGGGGGGGGGSTTSSSPTGVTVIPDPRLNALFVYARAKDIDMIEQLLQVIDQQAGPEEVQTVAAPRFIPVHNTDAAEIANVVRQVYASRLAADASQPRQPSAEDIVRALRGGGRGGRGGGGGGGNQANRGEEQKMTIGVDTGTNSLIVSAPDYLFNEVKALVEKMDSAVLTSDETVRVIQLKQTNAELLQRSLNSVLGESVTTNRTSASSGSTSSNNLRSSRGSSDRGSRSSRDSRSSGDSDRNRRNMEQFQRFMQSRGGGGRGR